MLKIVGWMANLRILGWAREKATGRAGGIALGGLIAFAVLIVSVGAAYRIGQEVGKYECDHGRIREVQLALEREKKLRVADQKIAQRHQEKLNAITRRYENAKQSLQETRNKDADCDAYMSRAEHQCGRDHLYGVPGVPGTRGS